MLSLFFLVILCFGFLGKITAGRLVTKSHIHAQISFLVTVLEGSQNSMATFGETIPKLISYFSGYNAHFGKSKTGRPTTVKKLENDFAKNF